MTRHLFIGGASDGTYHEVEPDLQYFRLRGDKPATNSFLDDPGKLHEEPIELYRRERFAVGSRVVAAVFVLQPLSTEAMFELLLANYRRGVPADPGEAYAHGFNHGWNGAVKHVARTIREEKAKTNGSLFDFVADAILRLVERMVR